MKIVHVLPHLGRGGAERVAVDLANYSVEAGHQVTMVLGRRVFDTRWGSWSDKLLPEIAVRHVVDDGGRGAPYLRLPKWLIENGQWLSEQHVIHCHLSFGAAFGRAVEGLRWIRRWKGPAVVEDLQSQGCPMPMLKRWMHMQLVRRRDAFVMGAEDPHWRKFLDAHPRLFSPVIANGIARPNWAKPTDEEKARYRKEIGLPADCRWVVLTLGRLVEERQPELYLPIFRKVADLMGPGVHFVYAGGGPASSGLLTKAAEEGLADRVHVTGFVSNPALPFSITDVYVTPGVGDVIGVAGIEAVFSELPVVAVQWLKDYDHNACTWIRSGSDPEDLAQYVVHLLKSPEAREAQVDRQNQYARDHLTREVMTDAYDKLYAQVVQRRGIAV